MLVLSSSSAAGQRQRAARAAVLRLIL